ncbi:hypothetical protein [Williamsia soli]|uniref:hypothetical protein n=1 Tax=Williamsia soli TaxID=364929 RepID=UPI001A9F48EE|nr:hypothetical protein [Williamsia soli]
MKQPPMGIGKALHITATPLRVAAAIATVLLLIAGFAPLPAALVLALYAAALLVAGAGMAAQRYRNSTDIEGTDQ